LKVEATDQTFSEASLFNSSALGAVANLSSNALAPLSLQGEGVVRNWNFFPPIKT